MTTDRQKICKCGTNVAEFIGDIRIFVRNLRTAKAENSAIFISSFKSSVNSMYSNINKIEDDCSIDASKTKWGHSDIFNKIDKMEADPTKFDEKRSEILIDLDRIEYDVIQKIKDCSK